MNGAYQVKSASTFEDERLNARATKILSHLYFPDAEWTIWCDSNLKLLIEPEELLEFFDYPEVGVYGHFKRNSINDEIDACKASKKDLSRKLELHRDMPGRLALTFIVIRRNSPKVAAANNAWWAEVTTKSRRDQLSFPYTLGPLATYRDIPCKSIHAARRSFLSNHFFRVPHKQEFVEAVKIHGLIDGQSIADNELAKILNRMHEKQKLGIQGIEVPQVNGKLFQE
ncbi:DUF616 domain-containing protein [Synechococcus sp. YX-04-1]|nr:DUF616 domain-containing protein [Synechococcus sp. YX-04-1]